jgi:hypothetical protein
MKLIIIALAALVVVAAAIGYAVALDCRRGGWPEPPTGRSG